MNKSLLESFNNNLEGCYYDKIINESDGKILPKINTYLDSEYRAYKFLLNYSKSGGKEALAMCFNESPEYEEKGKHKHTVALYYLGCFLRDIIDRKYCDSSYLKKFYNDFNFIDSKSDTSFFYSWFLTCLYHDLATSLEKEKYDKNYSLEKEIKKCNYNIFEHKFIIDNTCKSLYYPEKLIKNYFKYIKETRHSIEHGINAGYRLFNEFRKNYDDAWIKIQNKFQTVDSSNNNHNYNCFTIENENHYTLSFNSRLIDHFAIVAQTIMCHNIWNINTKVKSKEEVEEYKKNGLDELIIGENEKGKKISLEKWPLLFFLDLLDSIEPIKSFPDHDCESVLENISIDYDSNKKLLTIKANPKVFCIRDFYKWTKKIKDLQNWMDLNVDIPIKNDDERVFEITFNMIDKKEDCV